MRKTPSNARRRAEAIVRICCMITVLVCGVFIARNANLSLPFLGRDAEREALLRKIREAVGQVADRSDALRAKAAPPPEGWTVVTPYYLTGGFGADITINSLDRGMVTLNAVDIGYVTGVTINSLDGGTVTFGTAAVEPETGMAKEIADTRKTTEETKKKVDSLYAALSPQAGEQILKNLSVQELAAANDKTISEIKTNLGELQKKMDSRQDEKIAILSAAAGALLSALGFLVSKQLARLKLGKEDEKSRPQPESGEGE